MGRVKYLCVLGGLLAGASWLPGPIRASEQEEKLVAEAARGINCGFSADPDAFLSAQARALREAFERSGKWGEARSASSRATVDAREIPRHNFIDDEIFNRLADQGVPSAPLSTDEEFVRRIYLDLTGRIPTVKEIRDFIADGSGGKRDELIDRLLESPEFVDKWAMWWGDLLQNGAGNLSTSSIPPRVNGRNAFHNFIKASVASDKPISDFVWELIGFSGNNYSEETGMVNFLLRGTAAMGPRQDTLDMQMVKSVTAFLGMSQYDCIACHNGRGHLDQFSLSGKSAVRTEAWRMAAFFARTQLQRPNQRDGSGSLQYKDPLYDSTLVVDTPTGFYVANTLGGNRPDRCANGLPRNIETNRCAASENVSPEYRDGRKPEPGESWRQAFAGFITTDPMFARNFANRLWKAMFNLGLVEPMDQMDPARLDPSDPPPAPWTLQASHPELLEKLAQAFAGNGYSMRAFLRLLAQSSAYQLSSRYDGAWRIEYVPLFARHYPRRLDAEEIHDAIVKATDRPPRYTYPLADGVTMPRGSRLPQSEPFVWAMQSPDTTIANTNFISAFSRGNRDTEPRNQAGSILQQLNLMNDRFVTDRLKVNPSPVLREMAGIEDNAAVTEEMFLTFLSRMPSDRERQVALEYLSRAANRNTGLEDLAWALVNKVDFLFSY